LTLAYKWRLVAVFPRLIANAKTAKMEAMIPSDQPQYLSGRLEPPDEWLGEWLEQLLAAYPQIEQVYLLGDRARGPQGQKPDYSLLLYAGYDNALSLMTSLARGELALKPSDAILHLYVENYGATFCGIWGGALIPNEYNRDWEDGHDYLLWKQKNEAAVSLAERLKLPLERRRQQRRQQFLDGAVSAFNDRDQLQPVWKPTPDSRPHDPKERRKMERRRALQDLVTFGESA
jgi:hypothetical protein